MVVSVARFEVYIYTHTTHIVREKEREMEINVSWLLGSVKKVTV
jgi:hypothetical protein